MCLCCLKEDLEFEELNLKLDGFQYLKKMKQGTAVSF